MDWDQRSDRQSRTAINVLLSVLAAVFVAGMGFVAYHFLRAEGGRADATETIVAAQAIVNNKFSSSGGVHYAPAVETTVENLDEGRVKVAGTVQVVGPDGRTETFSYTCIMHQGDDGWMADDVTLVPI
jgi:hypothetical protein